MADERGPPGGKGKEGHKAGGFLGSLKEALAAASRDDTAAAKAEGRVAPGRALVASPGPALPTPTEPAPTESEAARAAAPRAAEAAHGLTMTASLAAAKEQGAGAAGGPPTTRVVRGTVRGGEQDAEDPVRTQLVRGKPEVKRGPFQQDPVTGWLVVVGGPGLGAFRPIFEGNNTVGRSPTQRIPIDFGDDSISAEEQAYIRYDSVERSFLFVPNLAKTNVVSVNNKRPAAPVELSAMDVITMGRTQLVFVPFCGPEFDWAELIGSGSKG